MRGVDSGYRILANTGLALDNFEMTASAYQINLTFDLCF